MYQQTDSDGLQQVIRLPIQPLLSVGRAFSGSVGTLPFETPLFQRDPFDSEFK